MFIMIIYYYYEKMCIVPFHLNQQCTSTYSTKKMRITVFMTFTENETLNYS